MPQLANKVVITCAITGSIHTPTMSDALPITPDQIATQSIDAAKAGATILHLHARDPKDGRPSPDPEIFRQFLPRIKQSCDSIINITTGGNALMTVDERIAAAETFSPEMCSLNMGSMNFALYPMARRYKNWKYDWEEGYLLNSDQNIFRNTFRDIERIAKTLGEGHGVKFEHECYDTGHLYNLAHCIDKGLFKPPVFLQLIYGILGGIGPDPPHHRGTRLSGGDADRGAADARPQGRRPGKVLSFATVTLRREHAGKFTQPAQAWLRASLEGRRPRSCNRRQVEVLGPCILRGSVAARPRTSG